MKIFGTVESFVEVTDSSLKLGRLVANFEFFRALLLYGNFDEYHLFCPTQHYVRLTKEVLEHELPDEGLLSRITLSPHLLLPGSLRVNRYSAFHVGGWYFYFLHLAHLRSRLACSPFPLTGVIHSLNTPEVPEKCRNLLEAPLRQSDAIVCTSQCGKDSLQSYLEFALRGIHSRHGTITQTPLRLERIPFGVDEKYFALPDRTDSRQALSLSPEAVVLLYLGRISVTKKADLVPLLYVFRRLVDAQAADAKAAGTEAKELKLILAGGADQTNRANLEAVIGELSLQDRVQLLINVEDETKMKLYAGADIFVSPIDNLQETFGLTMLEAMAAGLPVVASAFNGYRELVRDGETGYLTPTMWSAPPTEVTELSALLDPTVSQLLLAQSLAVDLECLEEQLGRLIGDAALRERMGQAGCRWARAEFAWPKVIAAYESLWEELRARLPAEVEPEKTQEDPAYADLYKVFGHYPTRLLCGDDSFVLSDMGRQCLAGELPMPSMYSDLGVFFSERVLQDLIKLMTHSSTSWEKIRKTVAASQSEAEITRMHLMWLVKYGILRRVP